MGLYITNTHAFCSWLWRSNCTFMTNNLLKKKQQRLVFPPEIPPLCFAERVQNAFVYAEIYPGGGANISVLVSCSQRNPIAPLPSLQMQEPSTGEQDAWLWQEQVDMQPGPYKPGGHIVAQSSPWGVNNAQSLGRDEARLQSADSGWPKNQSYGLMQTRGDEGCIIISLSSLSFIQRANRKHSKVTRNTEWIYSYSRSARRGTTFDAPQLSPPGV